MKKSLFWMLLMLFGWVLIGCGDVEMEVPSNFTIDGSVATWDKVNDKVSYRLELVNVDTEVISRRIVDTNTVDLNTLNLPEGDYMIKVQTLYKGQESEFAESLSYYQEDLYAVSEISESNLIDGVYIKWMGRTHYNATTKVNMIYHSASGFEVKFKGTSLTASLIATHTNSSGHEPYVYVIIDDDFENAVRTPITQPSLDFVLAEDLEYGEHKVTLYKSTESIDSHLGLKKIITDGKFLAEVTYKDRKIEVIAASSSTGYGNLGSSSQAKTTANSDAMQAYAFLTAQALNAEISIISASGWGCKFSRWTSPMDKNMFDAYKKIDFSSDIDWYPTSDHPDVVIMNLGTNDNSYIKYITNIQSERDALMEEFIEYYVEFINYIHSIYPNAHIMILYGLMNEKDIFDATLEIYERASANIETISVFKQTSDQAGSSSHPTAASHRTIAQNIVEEIKRLKGWD